MTKTSLYTAMLAAFLTGCGGESSSSNSTPELTDPTVRQGEPGTYAYYEAGDCGDLSEIDFDQLAIESSSKDYRGKPTSNAATALIDNSSGDVCLNGSLAQLTVSGGYAYVYVSGSVTTVTVTDSSDDVYIFGSVDTMTVTDSSADVHVFGTIGYLILDGGTADVYTSEVASYDNLGGSSDVMDLSYAGFD
ncbi:hypothetical protein GCM10011297_13610 [Bacterioplanes sanyensis]|uniref:hypothetical protein n=1 Tax=Bacterioplanes sanyensis TaxID=1249553 RepID=UPI001677175A|nr:hypothetical protein [Bacterioplanes sanyensis]GGY41871.1 hypothetical protein GCM10011297_13610 [Bacterioplanes sanyensis]